MSTYSFSQWSLNLGVTTCYYKGTGAITVTRSTVNAAYINITAEMTIGAITGDSLGWTFHCAYRKASGSSWTQCITQSFPGSKHTAGTYYGSKATASANVGVTSGSVDVIIWMTIDGYESLTGGTSAQLGDTFTYGSGGASTVTGDSNVTLYPSGSSFNINWTPADLTYKFLYTITIDTTTVSSSWIYPQTTSKYTHVVDLTADESETLINAITSGSAEGTVTLYTYTSGGSVLGSRQYSCTFTTSSELRPSITGLVLSGQDPDLGVFITGTSVVLTAAVEMAYSTPISSVYAIINGSYHYGTYVSETEWTIPLGTFSPSSSCVTYTANVYIKDEAGRSNSDQITFDVYKYSSPTTSLYGYSGSSKGSYMLRMTWSCSTITGNAATITLAREDETIYTASTLSGSDTYTDTVPTATNNYLYTLTVTDKKKTVVKTWTGAVPTLSFLRGGKGARFFSEAESTDSGRLTIEGGCRVYGSTDGYELYVAKSGGTVDISLNTDSSTYNTTRGIYDSQAGWSFYIDNDGKYHIGNADNKNRGLIIESPVTFEGSITIGSIDGYIIKTGSINVAFKASGTSSTSNRGIYDSTVGWAFYIDNSGKCHLGTNTTIDGTATISGDTTIGGAGEVDGGILKVKSSASGSGYTGLKAETSVKGLYDSTKGYAFWVGSDGGFNIGNSSTISSTAIALNSKSVWIVNPNGSGTTGVRLLDWITEITTVSGWKVYKYASGRWDCFYTSTKSVDISTEWGTGLYYGTIGSFSYPKSGTVRSCSAGLTGSGTDTVMLAADGSATGSSTPTYRAVRGIAKTVSVTLTIHAVID